MPAFKYEALDTEGALRRGVMESDTARAARVQLRTLSLIPIVVEPLGGARESEPTPLSWWQRPLLTSRAFTSGQRAIWIRQLASLVGSGVPVERAISVLADEAPSERQRGLLAAIRTELHAGNTLGRALALFPDEFPVIDRAVIEAGEHSGHLDAALEHLATDLEHQQALRAKLVGAAIYPCAVTVVALAIIVFLLGSVIPQVASVFEGSQRQLPMLTVAVLALGGFVRSWGWVMLLCFAGGMMAFRLALRRDALRLRCDAVCLRLPMVGRLLRGYNAARFAATLAMLSASGVPILRALQAAANSVSNRAMKADAEQALVNVREGMSLATALDRHGRYPRLLVMFARLGEKTGQLPAMLQRASGQLSNEVQRQAMSLASLLEPLLILMMGSLVMLIVLSVLMPIIEMNQWVL